MLDNGLTLLKKIKKDIVVTPKFGALFQHYTYLMLHYKNKLVGKKLARLSIDNVATLADWRKSAVGIFQYFFFFLKLINCSLYASFNLV